MTYGAAAGMWAAMTAAMMLPVVVPWLRAVHRIERGGGWQSGGGATATPASTRVRTSAAPFVTLTFVAGYAAAWTIFVLLAAALQTALESSGIGTPLRRTGGFALAVPLLLVGGYQFTGIKNRCLSKCRSPMGYLLSHWRSGRLGGMSMGWGHGLHCLGCCWALMLLALVVGHMHLAWMAVLTAVMVVETTVPGGHRAVRPVGAVLILAGLASVLG